MKLLISSWLSEAQGHWRMQLRIAYRELIHWMVAEFGFDKWDAYMPLSQCGIVRLGNFVDPKHSVAASVKKTILAR
ncbi:hypothetical protein [Mesorhizobium sp. INR15]|uniref:hypothetical protein n=1 Tax=Mesorhizobium sp. INR15 TaxID=2654248 RepID=UPI0021562D99|nr:hypothetical protein [Mesorhizobium sp. INR15]